MATKDGDDELDIFAASLGGSLMKDLLADLAVDEDSEQDWLSLAQLERELKEMDNGSNSNTEFMLTQQLQNASAAGMVVHNQVTSAAQAFANNTSGNFMLAYDNNSIAAVQQQNQQQQSFYHPAGALSALDAWSSTLAVSSLEDFLQADTARKSEQSNIVTSAQQSQLQTQTAAIMAPPPGLGEFTNYDVTEAFSLAPPPGLTVTTTTTTVTTKSSLATMDEKEAVAALKDKVEDATNVTIRSDSEEAALLFQKLTQGLERIHETEESTEDAAAAVAAAAAAATNQLASLSLQGDEDGSGMRTPPVVATATSVNFKSIPRPAPATPQNSMTFSLPSAATVPPTSAIAAPTPQPTPVTTKPINQRVDDVPVLNLMTVGVGMGMAQSSATSSLAMPSESDVTASMTTVPDLPSLKPIAEEDMDSSLGAPPAAPPTLDPTAAVGPVMMPLPHQQQQQQQHVHHAPVMPIVGVAVPVSQSGQPAWQTPMPIPPPQPQLPRRVIFANPHPAAPPVPAVAVQSRFMTGRDISYVVHSMMKPICAAEVAKTASTYHIEYWMRHHPVKPPTSARRTTGGDGKGGDDLATLEMDSRIKKAKEWSTERKVLGATTKSNVARPRALIALGRPSLDATSDAADGTSSDANSRQQRAALWKARIYCDQAYQCLTTVIDAWQEAGAGAPSALVQPHLLKLTKCLGISIQTIVTDNGTQAHNEYTVDPDVLQLLLRLPKGKVLLARVLEQALLPPAAVSALLPSALQVLTAHLSSESEDPAVGWADDRVFAAWTVVLQRLPDLPGSAMIRAVEAILESSKPEGNGGHNADGALSSTARMQCTHALLQRGSALAAADATFGKDWSTTEASFMNLLAGL